MNKQRCGLGFLISILLLSPQIGTVRGGEDFVLGGEMEYRRLRGNFVVCKQYRTLLGTFLTDLQGKDLRRLSYLYGPEVSPRFSPDGQRILFNSTRGGRVGVWIMDRQGKNQKRVCDGDQGDWFPDGTRIVLRREGRIVERVLATGQERVLSPPGWDSCSFPACSPEGQKILFVAEVEGQEGLFVLTRGRREAKCLVRAETLSAPRWSPEGKRIAYQRGAHLWVMDAEGKHARQLTTAGGIQRFPVWAPDGTAIAYSQGPSLKGPWRICVTSADGSQTVPIPKRNALSVLNPDWGPEEGLRTAPAASVLWPAPRLAVWDTGQFLPALPADWEAFLREKKGWKPLPVGLKEPHRLQGGVVIENEWAVFLLCGKEVSALLLAKPLTKRAAGVGLIPLAEQEEAKQVEALRVLRYGGEEAVVELASRSASGQVVRTAWRIFGSRPLIEVRPLWGAERLRLRARLHFLVVPDRFANDLVLDPHAYPNARCTLPSEPLLLGFLRAGDRMLLLVCPAARQRAELGPPQEDYFPHLTLSFARRSLFLALLAGDRIWYEERFSPPRREERVKFRWEKPFSATWRLAVRGEGKHYSNMFAEKPSACFDGKRAFLQKGEDFAANVDLALIYLYGRTENTPLDTLTPLDLIYDALGLKPGREILDEEGLTAYRTAAGWTTWSDLPRTIESLRYLFNRRLEVQERVYVGHLCDDLQPFIEGLDQRLGEYRDFAAKVERLCQTASREAPTAAKFTEGIAPIRQQLAELGQQQGRLKRAAEVAAYCRQIKQLTAAESPDNRSRFEALSRNIREVVGPREEMLRTYRRLAKELRDRAGWAAVRQPELIELAEGIRKLARAVLRNRYYIEGDWRGENYEVPPYWLGPRPWEK
ncbi:MAG TPA: hypothetical protein EYP85_05855 [Armatimonadetes bacterium]|nr:hypothetical protein [Armatimonadota bacterium]